MDFLGLFRNGFLGGLPWSLRITVHSSLSRQHLFGPTSACQGQMVSFGVIQANALIPCLDGQKEYEGYNSAPKNITSIQLQVLEEVEKEM